MNSNEGFINDTMKIIYTIEKYKKQHGNIDIIQQYYQGHGSYSGIVEYINTIKED